MVSDDARGYHGVKNEYAHVVVNHSAGQYVNGAFHTNGVENFWSLFKRGIIAPSQCFAQAFTGLRR